MSHYCEFDAEVVGESGYYTSADETTSAYDESDAEAVDYEDAGAAADLTFRMLMADPKRDHEPGNVGAEVMDSPADSVMSGEETISTYRAQLDVGRMGDLGSFVPDNEGGGCSAQPAS